MRIKTKLILGGALALASCITGVGGFSNDTYAAYDAEGIPANEAFSDNVFYGMVVDSYHANKYISEHGGVDSGLWEGYDATVERKKVLTNEQLASIKRLSGYDCPVSADQSQSVRSLDGLELLTGLEEFDSGTCNIDVDEIDFSNNPNLKYFLSYTVDSVERIDFRRNMSMKDIYIMTYLDENMPTVYLPDSDSLKNIWITSFSANNQKLESSLPIVVNVPTYKSDELGLGDAGSSNDTQYKLNLGKLGFFYDSSTAGFKKEDLTNEQFAVDSNQTCYSLSADNKILLIKESCIENGKITVGLTHKYKVDGNQISARFEATINFVDVVAMNFVDGALGELNDSRSKKIALGDSLNTNDYLSAKFHTGLGGDDERATFPQDSEYEIKSIKTIYATVPMSSLVVKSYNETGLASRDTKRQDEALTVKDFGKVDDDTVKTILVMYNYTKVSDEEGEVKAPDTGMFTADGKYIVAGVSIVAIPVVSIIIYAFQYFAERQKSKVKFNK